jgi:hypothetical protein
MAVQDQQLRAGDGTSTYLVENRDSLWLLSVGDLRLLPWFGSA